MMRFHLIPIAVTGILLAPMSTVTHAAIAFRYAAAASAYSGSIGQTIDVPLYLVETVTAGDASLLASEHGLVGGGLGINRISGAATIAAVTPSAAFGGPGASSVAATAASFTESVALAYTTGVAAIDLGDGISQVLLGTLRVTIGDTPTTFTLAPYVNGNGTTGGNTLTFDNFLDLDRVSVDPAYSTALTSTVTVSAAVAPEPTMLAAGAAFAAAALRRRRRVRTA